MSAFQVSSQSINEMVTAIKEDASENKGFFACYISSDCLAEALVEMNGAALESRYEGRYKVDYGHTYERAEASSLMQLYKTFTCFLYQCFEGETNETPLFKAMDAFAVKLARSIIYLLSEFQAAKWQ